MARAARSEWMLGSDPFARPDGYVAFTMAFPCTCADVIARIAEELKLTLKSLPLDFGSQPFPWWKLWSAGLCDDMENGENDEKRMRVHGSAKDVVEALCRCFTNVDCKISARTLEFRVKEPSEAPDVLRREKLLQIAATVGRGRLAPEEWSRICVELDNAQVTPRECLEREGRAFYMQLKPEDRPRTVADLFQRYPRLARRGLQRLRDRYQNDAPKSSKEQSVSPETEKKFRSEWELKLADSEGDSAELLSGKRHLRRHLKLDR